MAEVVEYRVDRTLDELKVLIDFGIFDEEHAKEIIKKREIFEYNLRRRTKTKLDYLKYIRFEMNLLESIEKYKNSILKQTESMEDELERKIFRLQAKKLNEIVRARAGHVSVLYRRLVSKNQFDKRLWRAYIDFAKQRKWNSRVSALYWRLLRVSANDESLWIEAAKHEIENNQNQNTARKLFLMGVRHHRNSLELISQLQELHNGEALQKYKEQLEKESSDANAVVEAGDPTTASSSSQANQSKPAQSKMETLYECYEAHGIDKTRLLYEDLEKSVKNQKLSLYVGMIQVESWQLAKDNSKQQLDRIRAIYEKAISKYGQNKAKLWYEYLQFEHQNGKSLEDLERINRIYERAQATLVPSKVGRVIEKYTMLQVNPPDRTNIEYSDYSDLED
uniref:U3 small nucleolar RNA-associated protein 6 n=1 Tax=Aceria tosichella TaxID=561515 RepID=A0A6G1SP06_9ACAR